MRKKLLDDKTDPLLVKKCPKCNSLNLACECVFDFKLRIYCKDCDFSTTWHLNGYEGAVEEWNNQSRKGEK